MHGAAVPRQKATLSAITRLRHDDTQAIAIGVVELEPERPARDQVVPDQGPQVRCPVRQVGLFGRHRVPA